MRTSPNRLCPSKGRIKERGISMSSNKTTHLKLNQWAASDPVLRTEFNSDNSRLDSAIGSRTFQRMAGGKLSTNMSSIHISLEDFDLRQFRELQILCAPVVAAGSYTGSLVGPSIRLALNGSSNWGVLQRINATAGTRQGMTTHLILAPAGPCGYTVTSSGSINTMTLTDSVNYGDVLELTLGLSDNASFAAGTWYGVYGIGA